MHATYDRRADILSVRTRCGNPKHVIIGHGTFVIFADDNGIWQIDLEAETWDDENIEETLKKIKVETI